MSLVKQVIDISMAGIKLRSVRSTTICTGRDELVEFRSRDTTGLGAGTAGATGAVGAALIRTEHTSMRRTIIGYLGLIYYLHWLAISGVTV
jgi:hypothetical protein